MRRIPQRELRNNVSGVLRDVAAGETLRITVRGVPVADLVPVRDEPGPRRYVPREDLLRAFGDLRLDEAFVQGFLADVADATDDQPRDPWS
jgi:prevent-host-death family protein